MIELIYLKNKIAFEDDFEKPKKIWFEDWIEI